MALISCWNGGILGARKGTRIDSMELDHTSDPNQLASYQTIETMRNKIYSTQGRRH